jgi:lycopene cyclase domain-containing protein
LEVAVGEYTFLALVAVVVVVGVEVLWLRTGLLRRPAYAVTMVIMFVGQVVVDGWLTKLSAPIVLYDEERTTGVRFPWDIPIEDFLFGFALLTLVLLLWERAGARAR